MPSLNSPFVNFGDYLLAVRNAGTIGAKMDQRLLQTRGVPLGASEQVPSEGGFLIPVEFSREILQRCYLNGSVMSRCFQYPLTSNQTTIPTFGEQSRANGSRYGGIQGFWQGEADTVIQSRPKFAAGNLVAKKLTILCYLTNELAQDTGGDALGEALTSWALTAFSGELTFKIEDSILNGRGAGQLSGILSSQALIQCPKVDTQASSTVVTKNILDIWSRVWAPSRRSGVWLVHPDCEQSIIEATVNIGVAGSTLPSLYETSTGEEEFNTILGRPCVAVEQAQPIGSVGDVTFCDLSRYILAMREIRTAASIHVAFSSDQQCYRLVCRLDGQTIDQTPITPFNGSNTVSPFVCIAQRS